MWFWKHSSHSHKGDERHRGMLEMDGVRVLLCRFSFFAQ